MFAFDPHKYEKLNEKGIVCISSGILDPKLLEVTSYRMERNTRNSDILNVHRV